MLGALPLALPEYATPGLVQPNDYSILFGHSHFRGGFVQQMPTCFVHRPGCTGLYRSSSTPAHSGTGDKLRGKFMTRSCRSGRPSAVAASADLFRRTIAAPRWVKNELTLDHSTGVQLSRLLAKESSRALLLWGFSNRAVRQGCHTRR